MTVRPSRPPAAAPQDEGGPALITIDDVRAAGHCVRGAREWFERHGLDFRAFLRDGIDAEEFLRSGDALARRVVDMKRARLAHG